MFLHSTSLLWVAGTSPEGVGLLFGTHLLQLPPRGGISQLPSSGSQWGFCFLIPQDCSNKETVLNQLFLTPSLGSVQRE